MTWQETVASKRKYRESTLPKEWVISPELLPSDAVKDVLQCPDLYLRDTELEITQSSVQELFKKMVSREWSSLAIIKAFAHRSVIAQQLLNPLTEINFASAFEEAASCDQYLRDHGKPIGPLHGIPFSIKDSAEVKSLDTSMGYCAWVGHIAEDDSVIVAALRKAGAIPLVKTNCGHTLMMGETVNHLFGRTLNPYNRDLTPGGSSGGESALLAFRGSPIGIGTDIGGSIRLPSASTGLYGLRPSVGRVSYRGFADTFVGQEAVRSNAGPMGHSPEDLDLLMSAYMGTQPWRSDPDVLPIPWRKVDEEIESGTLCFAVLDGDELVTPHPPLRRGLKYTVEKLEKAGHKVIKWDKPIGGEKAGRLIRDFWTADGGEDVRRNVEASGEPMISEVAALLRMRPEDQFVPPDVFTTWQNQHERDLFARSFADEWESTSNLTGTGRPIDGMIIPAAPFLARPHGADLPESKFGMFEYTYANIQPVLDLSSGVFPTGLRQDPEIDLPDPDFVSRSELDAEVQALYSDPYEWTGAPIGLQVFGKRLEDEKVLAMMKRIKEALRHD